MSTLNLTVTTLADPSGPTGTVSLRQAIVTANADMTDSQENINFAVNLSGTIDLTTALPNLANNISINGAGGSIITVQRDSGAPQFSVFTVNSGETVNISGVTITGGDVVSGGGGGINNNGVLTAAYDIFTGNSAGGNINVEYVTNSPYGGGGINSTGTLIVNNSTFADNIAGGDGGGIYTTGASTITNSIFNGNTAACAGGIYNDGAETVSGSTFENSTRSFYGGGIWNDYSGTLTVNDSTFANNTVAGAGGAIFGPGAQMIVNNSTFIDNSSQWAGGAICNYTGGKFIVTNSQ